MFSFLIQGRYEEERIVSLFNVTTGAQISRMVFPTLTNLDMDARRLVLVTKEDVRILDMKDIRQGVTGSVSSLYLRERVKSSSSFELFFLFSGRGFRWQNPGQSDFDGDAADVGYQLLDPDRRLQSDPPTTARPNCGRKLLARRAQQLEV